VAAKSAASDWVVIPRLSLSPASAETHQQYGARHLQGGSIDFRANHRGVDNKPLQTSLVSFFIARPFKQAGVQQIKCTVPIGETFLAKQSHCRIPGTIIAI
jgi:hypothetical protein